MRLTRAYNDAERARFSSKRKFLDDEYEGIPDAAFVLEPVVLELEEVPAHINFGVLLDGVVYVHRYSVCCEIGGVEDSEGRTDFAALAERTSAALVKFGKSAAAVKRAPQGWEAV